MIIRFDEHFRLPAEEVYDYFRTPADWARLYGFAGTTRDLGDGWYSVALKNFPFPLVARNTRQQENTLAAWVFRGFWRGRGEIRLVETATGVRVEGFEEIAVRWLFFLSPVVERLFMERTFCAVWDIGWHRLRKRETAEDGGSA